MKRIAFIGSGNMAEALMNGLLGSKQLSASSITASDINHERLEYIKLRYGVNVTTDNCLAIKESGIVCLSVKPQQMEVVLKETGPSFTSDHLVVSIAAGVTTGFIEKHIPVNTPVIRAMPNTPALLGAGATAVCGGRNASQEDIETARKLFASSGMAVYLPEDKINAVTALSGSGPAYVFYLAEALEQAGKEMGIPDDIASRLARQTIFGAGKMLVDIVNAGKTSAELRKNVTSPGGTTEAAIKYLQSKDFTEVVKTAVKEAEKRAKELAR